MNNEKIEGVGTVHEGEYNDIIIDGMGKLKGTVTAKKVLVSGAFRSKGSLVAEEVNIDGIGRIFRNIKTDKLVVDGMLKIRRAEVNADSVYCEGLLSSTGSICADDININGYCTVRKMMGDSVTINNDSSGVNKLVKKLRFVSFLYFGRKINIEYCLVDRIDCTRLVANGLKAKVVHTENARLGSNCRIDRLYCDGPMVIDPSCKIKKVITKNEITEFNQKGSSDMADVTVKKILDLYKNSTINEEEAEMMLSSVYRTNLQVLGQGDTNTNTDTPWIEDGKLRIVAFLGKRLLKKGDAGQYKLEVKYEGEALAVESQGNLTCGDISGNASAGGSISGKDIGGNVSCGGSISCKDIGGSVLAGGSISRI
ncbi:MAG: hypothetical protein K0R46_139 [Herbinix sp.]|jgi:cytoskeletal protein CcmA (bactofilin family)|nr:hypothetical protein [Herbinix sp.]